MVCKISLGVIVIVTPLFDPQTFLQLILEWTLIAQNVQGIIVPNSGHWIPEEQPDFVIKLLNNFFSGNPTETSK
jgi:pimeloyl-ACP methyl ester carboxylesterase